MMGGKPKKNQVQSKPESTKTQSSTSSNLTTTVSKTLLLTKRITSIDLTQFLTCGKRFFFSNKNNLLKRSSSFPQELSKHGSGPIIELLCSKKINYDKYLSANGISNENVSNTKHKTKRALSLPRDDTDYDNMVQEKKGNDKANKTTESIRLTKNFYPDNIVACDSEEDDNFNKEFIQAIQSGEENGIFKGKIQETERHDGNLKWNKITVQADVHQEKTEPNNEKDDCGNSSICDDTNADFTKTKGQASADAAGSSQQRNGRRSSYSHIFTPQCPSGNPCVTPSWSSEHLHHKKSKACHSNNIFRERTKKLMQDWSEEIEERIANMVEQYYRSEEYLMYKNHTIKLTEEDENKIMKIILSEKTPCFLTCVYLDEELNRICIGVQNGNLAKAANYFAQHIPYYFFAHALAIHESGDIEMAITPAADGEYTSENLIHKSQHGERLKNVESGKIIETFEPADIKEVSANGIHFASEEAANKLRTRGTIGGILQDEVQKHRYGVTAKHVYRNPDGYESGKMHTICDIHPKPNSKKTCHLSDTFMGYHGHVSTTPCYLDTAVFPLFDDIPKQSIDPFFRNNNGDKVKMNIYRGDIKKMSSTRVQHEGGISGKKFGEIIVTRFHMLHDGQYLGNSCFKVIPAADIFAQVGDSGSFVIDDISTRMEGNGYGVIAWVENKCVIPGRKGMYNGVAWCTRLNHGLDFIRDKTGLNLQFVPIAEIHKNRLNLKRSMIKRHKTADMVPVLTDQVIVPVFKSTKRLLFRSNSWSYFDDQTRSTCCQDFNLKTFKSQRRRSNYILSWTCELGQGTLPEFV